MTPYLGKPPGRSPGEAPKGDSPGSYVQVDMMLKETPNPNLQDRHMFRRLCVTASILCVAACAFILVLWVRSYIWRDSAGVQLYAARMVRVFSTRGVLEFQTYANRGEQGTFIRSLSHEQISAVWKRDVGGPEPVKKTWHWDAPSYGGLYVHVPHWFLALFAIALAAIPWIKWRFNLRTLLIVMTLIAVFVSLVLLSN